MIRFVKILFPFIGFQVMAQQGVIWIPSFLKGMDGDEIRRSLDSQSTAKYIYPINNSNQKGAIGHFNVGCISGLISLF